jgi:hypothetical protein
MYVPWIQGRVETHGIILNLQVKLASYPNITFPMDVLVIDVPDAWGMLLSRKWAATMGGTLQMDLTYATILSSENSFVKLYREKERKFHVEDPKEPMNEFVYHMSDIGNYSICSNFLAPVKEKFKEEKIDEVWKMHFDGAHSRSGKGEELFLLLHLNSHTTLLSDWNLRQLIMWLNMRHSY